MNPAIFIALLGVGSLFILKGASANASGNSAGSGNSGNQSGLVTRSNPWALPDIDSSNQGGGYSTSYDESFEKASGSTGVPFALLKAHAIRESSLNPNASHTDQGTLASYGLMQVEWNSDTGSSYYDRLSKYGYPGDDLSEQILSDPDTSAYLGACIIADNLNWLNPSGKNGSQGLRDTINAYNTGNTESNDPAPNNYVNDVVKYYSTITGVQVA